jgi:RHS repeat-associated protein
VHYAPFGDFAAHGDTLPRRMYTGYEYDAQWGLYNARKRLYSPTMRVFISVDPKFQFASPYLYCMSDPFNLVDPTGEMSIGNIVSLIITGITIVASIAITILTFGAAAPAAAEAEVASTLEVADMAAVNSAREVAQGFADVDRMAYLADTPIKDIARAGNMGAKGMRSIDSAERAGVDEYILVGARSNGRRAFNQAVRTGKRAATGVAAGGTFTAGVGGVSADAGSGEHISAYRAVNDVLIQPVIALASAGAAFGIGRALQPVLTPVLGTVGRMSVSKIVSYGIGGAAGGLMGGIVSSAANKQNLGATKTWENIGIMSGAMAALAGIFSLTGSIGKALANNAGIRIGLRATRVPVQVMAEEASPGPAPVIADTGSVLSAGGLPADGSFMGPVPEVPAGAGLPGHVYDAAAIEAEYEEGMAFFASDSD